MISLGPGQRESGTSGREQDLTTPILQTVAIIVCCVWALVWFSLMALAVGSTLGYLASVVTFAIRWEQKQITKEAPPWWWIFSNVAGHVTAPVYLDIIWTSYNFGWTPWITFLFSLLCVMMIAAAWELVSVLRIRQYDPNFPPTRGAIGRTTPIRPGTKEPGEVEIQVAPEREEVRLLIEDHATTETARPDIVMCTLFAPVGCPGNLALYAAALIREDATRAEFSHAGGKHHHGAEHWGYTRKEFDEFRKECDVDRAGLVHRKRDNQPYELTDRGRFTFERIAQKQLTSVTLSPAPVASA